MAPGVCGIDPSCESVTRCGLLPMAKLSTSVRTILRSGLTLGLRPLGPAVVMLAPLLLGCPPPVVGSPCNHGDVQPPESKLVTFPALSCDQLLCVYADEEEPPTITGGCNDDAICNPDGGEKFECFKRDANEAGECQLRIDYVLERSMCSKKCSSDNDCKDGGPTEKVVVDDSKCSTGFKCARIQSLGKFCCEKLCVCNDDLGVTADLDSKCSSNSQEGCCVDALGTLLDPLPEACGKP